MVTTGKSSSSMGWVVIEVAIGFACHSQYDLPIRTPGVMKPKQTIDHSDGKFLGTMECQWFFVKVPL